MTILSSIVAQFGGVKDTTRSGPERIYNIGGWRFPTPEIAREARNAYRDALRTTKNSPNYLENLEDLLQALHTYTDNYNRLPSGKQTLIESRMKSLTTIIHLATK
jgi:hypothetical protein